MEIWHEDRLFLNEQALYYLIKLRENNSNVVTQSDKSHKAKSWNWTFGLGFELSHLCFNLLL